MLAQFISAATTAEVALNAIESATGDISHRAAIFNGDFTGYCRGSIWTLVLSLYYIANLPVYRALQRSRKSSNLAFAFCIAFHDPSIARRMRTGFRSREPSRNLYAVRNPIVRLARLSGLIRDSPVSR